MGQHPPRAEHREHGLETVREAARRAGGRCLSDDYVNHDVKLEFECRDGHRWHTRPRCITAGKWCPECSHRPRIRVVAMQALAQARGGVCLSTTYIAAAPGMRWRCAEGHEWSAMPTKVVAGSWCPSCGSGRKTLDDMQALAAKHGGRCLSASMTGPEERMAWECARGHHFAVRRRCVVAGQWCPTCRKTDVGFKKVLERAQVLAARHGGRCLTREPVEGEKDPCFEWECAEGHRFAVRRRCVAAGQWCPTCRKADGSWAQALARIKEEGGVCLARGEPPSNESVGWRCAQGHVWRGSAYNVARGAGCLRCEGRRLGIEHMQEMAAEHGGRCISRTFVDAKTELHWECAQGHRWWAVPLAVRHRDAWCPECRPKPKIADAWSVALARATELGGVCLAETRSNLAVGWRCAKGHEWRSAPYKIAAGLWCSHCSARRLGIEHMHAMAAERDGRCISTEYGGCHTKLQWECEKGHRWWARPTILRQTGCWCPHCAWDRNAERMRSEARDRR